MDGQAVDRDPLGDRQVAQQVWVRAGVGASVAGPLGTPASAALLVALEDPDPAVRRSVAAAIEALPEIVQAVGGKVPVLLDSGIRRGSDVVKALALGAKVVLLGRPICWGVGVGGARGVERVFQIITEEIKRVLIMTGVSSIAQVTESLLIRSQPVGPL